MRIETERLVLRNYTDDDYNDLYEYLSDSEVVAFEPYKPMSESEVHENLAWRISTEEMIAVVEKKSGKMIGNIYLGNRDCGNKEIGYVFHRSFWGKGYATEACKAVISSAFSSGTHRIYAECDPNNSASWKLLERLGFVREAYFKQNVYFWKDENGKPIWKDTYVYSLLTNCSNQYI
ncbi:MAG: GNAT family N-acetyltransferase [Acetatifactor sp.]